MVLRTWNANYNYARSKNIFINQIGLNNIIWEVFQYIIRNYENDTLDEISNFYIRLTSPFYLILLSSNTVDRLFVLNMLNFALWYPKNSKQWRVEGQSGQAGYSALCAAIFGAIMMSTMLIYLDFAQF